MYSSVTVTGKGGISAKIVLDSVADRTNTRMVTYEVECHRYIWAEVLTHKMLSRNAASSRAIPNKKAIEQCSATPIEWQLNKAGMQSNTDISGAELDGVKKIWEMARESALNHSSVLASEPYSLHKQWASRIVEPFQMMKAVISATEWDNFFWLRNHDAAQPEIHELARCMYDARKQSIPQVLLPGEWHLPFIKTDREEDGTLSYKLEYEDTSEGMRGVQYLSLEDALKVSAARCAAVSFRNIDYGLEKSREVWDRLVGDERKHSSAMEHQAKVMLAPKVYEEYEGLNYYGWPHTWEEGISHTDREGNLWSGNLRNFIQLRKLIEGECCYHYVEK